MVDIESLLAPISDEAETGTYLKLDRSAYRSLRNSYNTAQSSFRQLIETPDASSDEALLDANDSNWAQLRQDAFDALTKSTKDIELLGWYIASQLFTAKPYQALADSTKVLTELVERYWSTLHPTLPENKLKSSDEQGIARELAEFRIKPLLQLVGESNDSTALFMPLQLISLIDEITYGDYLRAERSGELASLKEAAQSQFSSDVEETVMLLSQSYQHFSQAEAAIAKECQEIGVTPTSFRFVKANIANSINAIRFLTEEKFANWPLDDEFLPRKEETVEEVHTEVAPEASIAEPQAEMAAATSTTQSVESAAPTSNVTANDAAPSLNQALTTNATAFTSVGNLASRDHAFQELRKIAEYFKATEPHSPISFLLERAIRWGYMSLPELLQEMTGGNNNVMEHINQLTGMDNLDKVDLADKGEAFSPTVNMSNPVVSQAEVAQVSPSSVTLPTEESVPTQPIKTEETTSKSPDSLSDFEW
ncbi:ImpA family type VI secretion system protein [Vibrio ouci]|uniref:Type VI secretion protein n=1 Tax=Vibrio ouci TaxID=2499078 RepID=A0A4Y8WCT0_9VIBR|nr:type VI secretion system ImpA family N-terminal domain-containing protein [Vibrio ouci]TFH90614.1 type VI secretion protein [Vibrio ouci]